MIHEAIFKTNVDTMDQFTNYLYVRYLFFGWYLYAFLRSHLLAFFQQNFVYISLVQQFFEQVCYFFGKSKFLILAIYLGFLLH